MSPTSPPATSPLPLAYKDGVNPTSLTGVTYPRIGHAMDLFRGPVPRPDMLNVNPLASMSTR